MKNNKRKKGFTLVELLAVIIVLGIVASIVIVTNVTGVLDNSKTKISKASLDNIIAIGKNFVLENTSLVGEWITDNSDEYNCVSVDSLIKRGYLKEDVLKSGVVRNDVVVLERDTNKTISKSIYLKYDDIYNNANNKRLYNFCEKKLPSIKIKLNDEEIINDNDKMNSWYTNTVGVDIELSSSFGFNDLSYEVRDESNNVVNNSSGTIPYGIDPPTSSFSVANNGRMTLVVIINGISATSERKVKFNIDNVTPVVNFITNPTNGTND